jgi:hypothetical protein
MKWSFSFSGEKQTSEFQWQNSQYKFMKLRGKQWTGSLKQDKTSHYLPLLVDAIDQVTIP